MLSDSELAINAAFAEKNQANIDRLFITAVANNHQRDC
jgi:hypothetical protein